ncbi:hypothetical protein, partial [Xanthomonas bromi]|uniref:hypothetical protein n=1 Tax=Xanthomonas bromi TaxID=56449 RepID=UPI001ADEE0D8
ETGAARLFISKDGDANRWCVFPVNAPCWRPTPRTQAENLTVIVPEVSQQRVASLQSLCNHQSVLALEG